MVLVGVGGSRLGKICEWLGNEKSVSAGDKSGVVDGFTYFVLAQRGAQPTAASHMKAGISVPISRAEMHIYATQLDIQDSSRYESECEVIRKCVGLHLRSLLPDESAARVVFCFAGALAEAEAYGVSVLSKLGNGPIENVNASLLSAAMIIDVSEPFGSTSSSVATSSTVADRIKPLSSTCTAMKYSCLSYDGRKRDAESQRLSLFLKALCPGMCTEDFKSIASLSGNLDANNGVFHIEQTKA